MSRITKWKLEKTKVKVVFRLQFHATHIPQSGWDKLFISFVPADSGKATAKTTKAIVRNGTCKWADPIYETTRLLQDVRNKQYDDKLYKLVVAMGSSRSSILGEATINLADHADALKPSVVALPLLGCDSGTTLHVTVQLLTSKTGFREFEQQRELSERGLQTGNDQISPDESCGGMNNQMEKVSARVRLKEKSKELPSLEEKVGMNEDYADSAAGFDGSSNTSESLYAEKQDTSSTHEIDSLKSMVSGDLAGLSQSPQQEKGDSSDHRFLVQGTNDWVPGWGSDYSVDNDLATAYEENCRLRGCLEVAELSINELKLEVTSLQSYAADIGTDAQKLAQKLVAEIASGEQLAKQVLLLKSECSNLKDDVGRLTKLKTSFPFTHREAIAKDQDHLFESLQFGWVKALLILEDKIRELQKKASLGLHETEFRSLQADIEALLSLLQDLKQGNGKANSFPNIVMCEQFVPGTGFGTELYQPELDMLQCVSIPGLMSHEPNSINASKAVESKIFELLRELDESKAGRENLEKKMDQMECYYEALVQELEENQRQMLGELQNLRNEHSTCLYTISSAKAEMEAMHHNLDEQILRFSQEKRDLESLNTDLERRAFSAEAALKRARLNYSIAVDQLQKDLQLLSSQVLSMFETNENLIRRAFVDLSQPSSQEHPHIVQNQKLNSEESYVTRLLECQNQYFGQKKQQLGGDTLLEDLKRSLHLQEGLYQKVEEEACEMHFVNIYLDVFSRTLQESLLEASAGIRLLTEKMDELARQLELSTESKELLEGRLQSAMNDIHFLNESKATCIAKCSDMALQNQILEANLQDITCENHHLTQKIAEWESLLVEFKSSESKYEACAAEKTELAKLLEKKSLENSNLQQENSSLQEEFKTMKTQFDELASANKNMQNTVNFLQNKMLNLLSSYGESFSELSLCRESVAHDLGSKDLQGVVLQLEELQKNACQKICQIMEEKKSLIDEKDKAQVSLSKAESDIVLIKKKFEHDIRDLLNKLDESNALVQNLQLKVETIADKLKVSSEVEESHAQQERDLLSDLDHLEVELEQLSSKNSDLVQEILALEIVTEELRRSEQMTAELTEKNQALMVSLQKQSEESAKFTLDAYTYKERLQSLHVELQGERSVREELESAIQMNNQTIAELTKENQTLMVSLQNKSGEFTKLALDANDLKESLKSLQDELHCERRLREDLESTVGRSKLTIAELIEENQALMLSSHNKSEESAKLALDVNTSKETLQSLQNELHGERSLRDELENKVLDLTSQLNEKDYQLQVFEQYESELVHLKQLVSDLESEKSRLCDLLLHSERCLQTASEESSSVTVLESQLSEMHELLLASNVRFIFIRTQYLVWVEEFVQQSYSKGMLLSELQIKNLDLEDALGNCLAREVQCNEENARLLTRLDTLKSEMHASIAENRVLLDTTAQLEEYKNRAVNMEANYHEKNKLAIEVGRLKHLLVSSEEEIDDLIVSREELHIKVLVLEAKLDELYAQVILLEGHNGERLTLQNQCRELTNKLSEQLLKTEEFKNLSIHLKELKDKAEAECIQLREKKESEGLPTPMQESLRIAFIKEQYETKVQELKHQLSVSRKHSEEMLWKLQDAIDEIENRKKSEASHLKKNEELGVKILELEVELQSLMSEKREKANAYDQLKSELECSLISLECCKQEQQKLEAFLKECNEEKTQMSVDLTMMRELLDSSSLAVQKQGNDGLHNENCMSNEQVGRNVYQENVSTGPSSPGRVNIDKGCSNGSTVDMNLKYLERDSAVNCEYSENTFLVPMSEVNCSSAVTDAQAEQNVLISSGVNGLSNLALGNQENLQPNDMNHLAFVNDHFRVQSLKSSMDHLNEELERMKNENSLVLLDDKHFDPKYPGLQREMMQLHKVNEELGSIYPLFNERPGNGNAIERVLALEIELAEALQAKKKSSFQFQSSFLKQHNDEEAIFQSFRDINALIKDMLDIKGRHAAMETELKEMHDRYSQLSLQFAEVEGERQKLMMTLKNVRASKRFRA
ncbi:putative leucine-rich repeat-containing protein DDB_G0290503 [Mangifera indica]|uniref:putative leucine-rich repeat-containing protein DDB_G0290503 n=1 Tax=Mangifera indica TaxID=29780 RepID=UPI001CF9A9FC|nr:putative leucine-rich repeat-containing protein DDB_G0290503 [Mangifera indica]XP_044475018.1 putative leucine-rich repeat-containing protein DDB_G0290503 [Mangifera indica]XP_044475019.1 putative leucine-rich repeat-containing protein DDB_G0290503 [Mangifera indica]